MYNQYSFKLTQIRRFHLASSRLSWHIINRCCTTNNWRVLTKNSYLTLYLLTYGVIDLCQTMLRALSLSGFRLVGANGLVMKIPETGLEVTSFSRWVVTITLTSIEYGYPVPTISGSLAMVYWVLSPGTSMVLENSTIRGGRTPSGPGAAAPSWDSGVHSRDSWSSWSSTEKLIYTWSKKIWNSHDKLHINFLIFMWRNYF